MVGAHERLSEIAQTILNTKDIQVIENRKVATVRRLRLLRKESQPIEFAEAEFELACCYLLRYDRRVHGRQMRHAENHYNLAIRALSGPTYAVERAIVQSVVAEGYDRLRSKRDFHDSARDRVHGLLQAAAASFLEGDHPVDAAATYTRLAELWSDEGDRTLASKFGDQALSLVLGNVPMSDVEKTATVLDRLLHVQQGLADSGYREMLVEQQHFSAATARELVTAIAPGFNEIPSYLMDELFESVGNASALNPANVYSLGDLVEAHRHRFTRFMFPPPRDRDLFLLDSLGGVSGSQLKHLASRYRDARISPLGYAIVPVYYATDRPITGSASPDDYFADGRDSSSSPSLSFGLSHVSIPRDHKMGSMESPRLWKFERQSKPDKHVMVVSLTSHGRNSFFSAFDSDLASHTDGAALLFIHGYNVTFSNALKRTAQLCYDLGWPGIPITYSWPSGGKARLYPADEASIDATVPFLVDFLERLTGREKLRVLHIVCHSMGSRALTGALATLIEGRRSRRPLINEVVLAAPDIDSQVFAQLAAAIRSKCDRITLYASSKDLAIAASRTLHAFPRAGESGPNMVILPDLLDTIDATAVDTNLLGHSYYGDNRSIIADLFSLVNRREPPANRFGLRQLISPKGRYWAFQP